MKLLDSFLHGFDRYVNSTVHIHGVPSGCAANALNMRPTVWPSCYHVERLAGGWIVDHAAHDLDGQWCIRHIEGSWSTLEEPKPQPRPMTLHNSGSGSSRTRDSAVARAATGRIFSNISRRFRPPIDLHARPALAGDDGDDAARLAMSIAAVEHGRPEGAGDPIRPGPRGERLRRHDRRERKWLAMSPAELLRDLAREPLMIGLLRGTIGIYAHGHKLQIATRRGCTNARWRSEKMRSVRTTPMWPFLSPTWPTCIETRASTGRRRRCTSAHWSLAKKRSAQITPVWLGASAIWRVSMKFAAKAGPRLPIRGGQLLPSSPIELRNRWVLVRRGRQAA